MGYIILICEDIDMQTYQTTENLETYKQLVISQINFPVDKYDLVLTQEKYIDTDTSATDLVKRIKINVKYNFDNKEREIQINKIKVKE